MTIAAKISYATMALLLLSVLVFSLGHIVLAALFSFMFMEAFLKALERGVPAAAARWLAAIAFIATAAVIIVVFLRFIKQTLATLPGIVEVALPQVMALAQKYGLELPFADFHDLRDFVNKKILANALSITKASTLLTREVFHMAIGVVAAMIFFAGERAPKYETNIFDAVRKETNLRICIFMLSFRKIFGAQIIISIINTMLTALFLHFIAMPHLAFLTTMTFIVGIIPIVGNIITNTVIVITALGLSVNAALLALVFLVLIHTLEHFLNSKIMGASVNLPMWQMLIAILIGNTIMGIPGIMLAPAILHYIKTELQAIPWTRHGAPQTA